MGEHDTPAIFETTCSADERKRGEEIWFNIRYGMIAEMHPAANRVCSIKLNPEEKGQADIVPHVIGNYFRLSKSSFGGADKFIAVADDVEKAKALIKKIGFDLNLGRIEESDAISDRGRKIIDDIQILRSLLDEARVALVGAEQIACRVRDLSRGDRRVGLDVALLGAPLRVMARQLGHIWLGNGLSLAGGRSGDGIDVVILRIVEAIRGERDRGSQKWLKELMTYLRDELSA